MSLEQAIEQATKILDNYTKDELYQFAFCRLVDELEKDGE